MKYEEVQGDLFSAGDDYYYVQCGSADLALGKGIAIQFNEKFGVKQALELICNKDAILEAFNTHKGLCIPFGMTITLITKRHYYDKPTYETLSSSLMHLREICKERGIKKLAMPKIGCGLDRLSFDMVRGIIYDVFIDMDIEIKVYYI